MVKVIRRPTPRAKREVRRGRRHRRSGARKRVTVFLSAPLVKKVSRLLAAEGRDLDACLEEALEMWLRGRQPDPKAGRSVR
ncbi:MAG: hypothetical protein ACE5IQ_02745 [Candidatus Methylomirabilales bacterium]